MSARRARLVAVGMVIAAVMLIALALVLAITTSGEEVMAATGKSKNFWDILSLVGPIMAFSVVGALIVTRQPGNLIGWLLSTIGLLFAVVFGASVLSIWGAATGALSKRTAEWISLGGVAWVPALGLIGTQLPLRLPDGELPSSRWRWYSRLTILLIAITFVGMAAQPDITDLRDGTNPLHVPWLRPLAGAIFLLAVCFIAGLVALVGRYRRSGSHDRAQLRWIAFGGAVFVGVYLVTLPFGGGTHVVTFFAQLSFAALPIAIGYAILRHRLYDIDVVINRTLVYGALTATLAGTYVGAVLLLQLLLNGATGNSSLAVAASTLAVAALFRPARRRIQGSVDRRFYRRKFDAQRTLESFAARLRDQVALDALEAELRGVVAETMRPAHLSLWLRETGGKR